MHGNQSVYHLLLAEKSFIKLPSTNCIFSYFFKGPEKISSIWWEIKNLLKKKLINWENCCIYNLFNIFLAIYKNQHCYWPWDIIWTAKFPSWSMAVWHGCIFIKYRCLTKSLFFSLVCGFDDIEIEKNGFSHH